MWICRRGEMERKTDWRIEKVYSGYFRPPESKMLCPVMYPVRQSIVTTFAHSSVLPARPTGMFLGSPGVPLRASSSLIIPVPVIMAGATSLKVTPVLPSLLARFLER